MPALRSLLAYGVALVAVFAIAGALGYVYEHDPQRDLVEVVIRGSTPPSPDGEFQAGTVTSVSDDSLQVRIIEAAQDSLAASTVRTVEALLAEITIEELHPLDDPADVNQGVSVNLGGERTSTERVISGVVLIAPGALP